MPYKSEKMKLTKEQDRRIKISEQKKKEIIALKGKISQRKCAELYGISRRSVVFLWYPERLEENKKRREERGGWTQYYDKEKWRETMKEHRHYKQEIYLERRDISYSHLFKSSDVFYVELDKKKINAIHSYATSIGVKIKLSRGVWFDTKEEKVLKLYKVEILEREPVNKLLDYEKKQREEKAEKIRKKKEAVAKNRAARNEKKERIIMLRCEGKKIQEIADIMKCSKQYISYVLTKARKD